MNTTSLKTSLPALGVVATLALGAGLLLDRPSTATPGVRVSHAVIHGQVRDAVDPRLWARWQILDSSSVKLPGTNVYAVFSPVSGAAASRSKCRAIMSFCLT